MTTMKRMTISLSPKQDTAILELRKTDQYCRMSYSKIIRLLLDAEIERIETGRILSGTAKNTGGT